MFDMTLESRLGPTAHNANSSLNFATDSGHIKHNVCLWCVDYNENSRSLVIKGHCQELGVKGHGQICIKSGSRLMTRFPFHSFREFILSLLISYGA